MRYIINTLMIFFCLTTFLVGTLTAQQSTYDTILNNGTIVDGTGLASYKADIGIRDGFIVAIGNLSRAKATNEYNVSGLYVTPGFINVHSHATLDGLRFARNMLTQGVTTEIFHADGSGPVDITQTLRRLKKVNPAENIGTYVGFNAVWEKVIGDKDRRATDHEIKEMQKLIRKGMKAGAWAVSSGLRYRPAYYATTNEVIRVVKAASPWRTVYRSHIRSESRYVLKAVKEDMTIGRKSGLIPVVTHIKAAGKENWGESKQMLNIMRETRANGIYTTADVYPYLASHTGLTFLLPAWAMDGGFDAMLKRIQKPKLRSKIKKQTHKEINYLYGSASNVLLPNFGTTLGELAESMGAKPVEAMLRLFERKNHNISAIMFYGAEKDLENFLTSPMVSIVCDCGATIDTTVHPRYFGTWPKVLGKYVREKGLLTWEQAIRKMTGLPAVTLGMTRRGFIAVGMIADITVFDPKTIIDKATYKNPAQYPNGIKYVFLHGKPALVKGKLTGLQYGKVLRRSRHMPARPMSVKMKINISASGKLKNDYSENMTLSFN